MIARVHDGARRFVSSIFPVKPPFYGLWRVKRNRGEMYYQTSNLGVGGSNPSERASAALTYALVVDGCGCFWVVRSISPRRRLPEQVLEEVGDWIVPQSGAAIERELDTRRSGKTAVLWSRYQRSVDEQSRKNFDVHPAGLQPDSR
jgi:hypothetical protein